MMLPGEAKVLLRHRQRQSSLARSNRIMYQASIANLLIQSGTASPESGVQSGVEAK